MNRTTILLLLIIIGIPLFLGLATFMTWMDLHYYIKLNEGVYQRVWMEKASFLLLLLGLLALVTIIAITIIIVVTIILDAVAREKSENIGD